MSTPKKRLEIPSQDEFRPRLSPTADYKSDKDRWLAEALSTIQQQNDWLIAHTVAAHNEAVDAREAAEKAQEAATSAHKRIDDFNPIKYIGTLLFTGMILGITAAVALKYFGPDATPKQTQKP